MVRVQPITFGEAENVDVLDPVTGATWKGFEQRAELPKPGGAGCRLARLAKCLLSPDEATALLKAAEGALELSGTEPLAVVKVMEAGQYQGKSFTPALRPVVDSRLLPYVRSSLSCPGAVVQSAELRRYAPGGCQDAPVRLDSDRHFLGTAVLVLNPEDARGGIFLQATSKVDAAGFVPLDAGDLLLHQYDLPQGVQVKDGTWYAVFFHFKDSMLACLTNTTPWYESRAQQGDVDAQANLGLLLLEGSPEPAEAAVAVKWLRAAAEQGHPSAQERLGCLYMTGTAGTERDAVKAVALLHQAALAGHDGAQQQLAVALLRGRGVEENAPEALLWLQRSAEQGNCEAMHLLVLAYSRGSGCTADLQKALSWCQRGAQAGHAELRYRLALHLLTGSGLPQDLPAAARWFRLAANAGHVRASCNLGALQAEGLGGLERSRDLAAGHFRRAAEAGDAEGQYNLALLHTGAGCSSAERAEGLKWCRLAQSQGHAKAAELLDRLQRGQEPLKAGQQPVVELTPEHRARLSALLAKLQEAQAGGEAAEELIAILQRLQAASLPPEEAEAVSEFGGIAPPLATEETQQRRRRMVPRVAADEAQQLRALLAAGEPVLVVDAMPQLSGKRVVEFMPRFINAVGKEQISYELQGNGDVQRRQTPLALFVQRLPQSAPGAALFMTAEGLLRHPSLAEFLEPPRCFGPDRAPSLPEALQPPSEQRLLMGGTGALSSLVRSASVACTWSLMVLGRAAWRLLPPGTTLDGLDKAAGEDGTLKLDTFSEDQCRGLEVWEATQEIGEVLLLPPGWWSQLRLEDRSLAVTGWQLPEAAKAIAAREVARRLGLDECRGEGELFKLAAKEAKSRDLQGSAFSLL